MGALSRLPGMVRVLACEEAGVGVSILQVML